MNEDQDFLQWLLDQNGRGDIIGDLAYEIEGDESIDFNHEELKNYLTSIFINNDRMIEALDEAYSEWYSITYEQQQGKCEPNFLKWLLDQNGRGDIIGDLASDMKTDSNINPEASRQELKKYLRSKNACREASEALNEAFLEWKG